VGPGTSFFFVAFFEKRFCMVNVSHPAKNRLSISLFLVGVFSPNSFSYRGSYLKLGGGGSQSSTTK